MPVTCTDIERYYDAVPRAVATPRRSDRSRSSSPTRPPAGSSMPGPARGASDVSPTTYAGCSPGRSSSAAPQAIESVDEVTPSLLPAVRRAVGMAASHRHRRGARGVPLAPAARPTQSDGGGRRASQGARPGRPGPEARLIGAVHAELRRKRRRRRPSRSANYPELIEAGPPGRWWRRTTRTAGRRSAAFGRTAGRGPELMGIGVPPARDAGSARPSPRRSCARAASPASARCSSPPAPTRPPRIYRRVGFEDVGTACILEGADG